MFLRKEIAPKIGYIITLYVPSNYAKLQSLNHSTLISNFSIMHYLLPGSSIFYIATTQRKPATVRSSLVKLAPLYRSWVNIDNPLYLKSFLEIWPSAHYHLTQNSYIMESTSILEKLTCSIASRIVLHWNAVYLT